MPPHHHPPHGPRGPYHHTVGFPRELLGVYMLSLFEQPPPDRESLLTSVRKYAPFEETFFVEALARTPVHAGVDQVIQMAALLRCRDYYGAAAERLLAAAAAPAGFAMVLPLPPHRHREVALAESERVLLLRDHRVPHHFARLSPRPIPTRLGEIKQLFAPVHTLGFEAVDRADGTMWTRTELVALLDGIAGTCEKRPKLLVELMPNEPPREDFSEIPSDWTEIETF